MRSRILQAFLKVLMPDNTSYPQAIANYSEKDTETVRHSPYGLCSQPPQGSLGLLFQVENSTGTHYGIFDYSQKRFKNLEEGEVQVGNYLTMSSIKFDKEGNVTVTVPGDLIANIDGNLTAMVEGESEITSGGNTTLNQAKCVINSDTTIKGSLNVTGDSTMKGTITTSGSISASGSVSAGGSISASGDVTGSGISLAKHIHKESIGGTTAPPT